MAATNKNAIEKDEMVQWLIYTCIVWKSVSSAQLSMPPFHAAADFDIDRGISNWLNCIDKNANKLKSHQMTEHIDSGGCDGKVMVTKTWQFN